MSGDAGPGHGHPTAPVTVDVSDSSHVEINITLNIDGTDLRPLLERLLLALEVTTAKR